MDRLGIDCLGQYSYCDEMLVDFIELLMNNSPCVFSFSSAYAKLYTGTVYILLTTNQIASVTFWVDATRIMIGFVSEKALPLLCFSVFCKSVHNMAGAIFSTSGRISKFILFSFIYFFSL